MFLMMTCHSNENPSNLTICEGKMILIDAIELRKKMEWICENTCPNKGNKDKETLCAACPLMGAFADLDYAEEIHAIPIEWIRNWHISAVKNERFYEYELDALSTMIHEWAEYGK